MKSLYRIYHPEVFQGALTDRNYFEGWYFKHVSADSGEAFAVITRKGAGTLKATSMGQMREENNLLFSGKGVRAGYEETDMIFTHF